jgi:hypothetical protein
MSAPQFSSTDPPAPGAGEDNRRAERHDLTGAEAKLLCDGMQFTIRLKDLSCTGICGLTDAPLAPGQRVGLMLDKWEPIPTQIRWIRKALIGASFLDPIAPELVTRMKRSHASKRKR